MTDDRKFDAFLKRNAPAAPPAKIGEKERLWRAIETAGAARPSLWKRWLVPVGALAAAASVALVMTIQSRPSARDREVEQILKAAIAYDLDAEETQQLF